jgi:hypothetical protein
MINRLAIWVLLLGILGGCYSPNVQNGKLHCSSDGRCPDGYQCVSQLCWRNGIVVSGDDMSSVPQYDMTQATAPNDMSAPVQTAHRGTATPAGAVKAQSAHYKVIMSTGEPPGGNSSAASKSVKLRGGAAGATQGN